MEASRSPHGAEHHAGRASRWQRPIRISPALHPGYKNRAFPAQFTRVQACVLQMSPPSAQPSSLRALALSMVMLPL
jgi:hypothetical protein